MFKRIHERLGTAGLVVAIVALVVALSGVAIAAGGLTKKQEKRVTAIAKKYAGKDGAQGPAGPTETVLPFEETLTGVWGFSAIKDQGLRLVMPITFPLRVEPGPAEFIASTNQIPPGGPSTPQCPGSASEPEAAPGEFCLYESTETEGATIDVGLANSPSTGWRPDPTSGFIIPVEIETEELARGRGTWAVTACPPPPTEEEGRKPTARNDPLKEAPDALRPGSPEYFLPSCHAWNGISGSVVSGEKTTDAG